MKKKLSRFGNSLGLIIDKPILELLNIKEDTMLHIRTNGRQLIITPETSEQNPAIKAKYKISDDPKLQKLFEEMLINYAEDFKKLADS